LRPLCRPRCRPTRPVPRSCPLLAYRSILSHSSCVQPCLCTSPHTHMFTHRAGDPAPASHRVFPGGRRAGTGDELIGCTHFVVSLSSCCPQVVHNLWITCSRRVAAPMQIEIRGAERLSFRERQVVALKEMGSSNEAVAKRLGLSVATVATLYSRAKRKGYQVVMVLSGDPLGIMGEDDDPFTAPEGEEDDGLA